MLLHTSEGFSHPVNKDINLMAKQKLFNKRMIQLESFSFPATILHCSNDERLRRNSVADMKREGFSPNLQPVSGNSLMYAFVLNFLVEIPLHPDL